MNEQDGRRRLRMIYREIPIASGCRPGCSECCGPVPWSPVELERIKDKIPPLSQWVVMLGEKVLQNPLTGACPFVSADGCTVYSDRPFMCRIYASSSDNRLTCPHGCRAKRPLSITQAAKLTVRYIEASNAPESA